MSLFLTEEEVVSLTNKVRHFAQAKALKFMGIEHKRRPDGSVAVLREHINKKLGGETSARSRQPSDNINWGAL